MKQEKNKKEENEKMLLSRYLAFYSTKRSLDTTFIKWFSKIDSTNPKKTKQEWDELKEKFLSE